MSCCWESQVPVDRIHHPIRSYRLEQTGLLCSSPSPPVKKFIDPFRLSNGSSIPAFLLRVLSSADIPRENQCKHTYIPTQLDLSLDASYLLWVLSWPIADIHHHHHRYPVVWDWIGSSWFHPSLRKSPSSSLKISSSSPKRCGSLSSRHRLSQQQSRQPS